MFNFKKLENKYRNEAPFNTMVNVFRNLIEKHGFLPCEIREGLFYAQYTYEMHHAEMQIRTKEDWNQIAKMRDILKTEFGNGLSGIDNGVKGDT